MSELYIGLMSGTSLDGVDGVLLQDAGTCPRVIGHAYAPFAPALVRELLALNSSGADELHRSACCANQVVGLYAEVVAKLLRAADLAPSQVSAIGAHGQTVRHQPQAFALDSADASPIPGYSLQLNNPALLAELTGIDVVADFRSRDVAAGGQGAPLVPAFHQAVFGRAHEAVAVLNIGGISNVSLLEATAANGASVLGFDCGPGNVLMDHWCQQHTGQAYDKDGAWAASGQVCGALLAALLGDAYFAKAPPKSTGRDWFNVRWLTQQLAPFAGLAAVDVQASLTALTAQCCAADVLRYGKNSKELIVCGGGALNGQLMRELQARLPQLAVTASDAFGLPPLQVEAAAFAWLARKTMHRETANLPKVTGARGTRILGGIYPA